MPNAAEKPAVDDLWTEYRNVLSRQKMTPKALEWHEKRARHFVWNRDRPALNALSTADVAGYFERACARGVLGNSLVSLGGF